MHGVFRSVSGVYPSYHPSPNPSALRLPGGRTEAQQQQLQEKEKKQSQDTDQQSQSQSQSQSQTQQQQQTREISFIITTVIGHGRGDTVWSLTHRLPTGVCCLRLG